MVKLFREDGRLTLFFENADQDFIVEYTKVAYNGGVKIIKDIKYTSLEFDASDEESVMEFVDELIMMSTNEDIEIIDVKGLEKPTLKISSLSVLDRTQYNDIVLSKPYSGLTISQALEKYQDAAVIKLSSLEENKLEIKFFTKKFLEKKYKDLSNEALFELDVEVAKTFIRTYKDFLNEKLSSILKSVTYTDLEEFLKLPDDVIKSAYRAMVTALLNKFK